MRLYAPMYEGDSFLRPDSAIGARVRTHYKAPAPVTDFVQSNIEVAAANQTTLDLHAIEQVARSQRSVALAQLVGHAATSIANALKAAHIAVADWLERIDYQERDNFFAASADLSDLEQRQRHYERTGCAHY